MMRFEPSPGRPIIDPDIDPTLPESALPDHVMEEAWALFLASQTRRAEATAAAARGASAPEAPPGTEQAPDGYPAPRPSVLRDLNAASGTGGHGMADAASDAPQAAVIEAGVNGALVPSDGIGVALGDTFRLHSVPGSTYKVFLDFDGHTTTGTQWNTYWNTTSFYSPAFSLDGSESFNATELLRIQQIWQRVAEFFSPFNIDVTTEDPGVEALRRSGTGDTAYGIRVVITDEGGKNWGGLTYNGSFNWSVDTAAFVYANPLGDDVHYIATAAAHEIGHSLGLNHDGQGGSEYYYGHGSGATSWAPTMGVGYYSSVIQWSKGDYAGATNTQDDLATITTQNGGVTWRADDYGNSFATAATLGGTIADGIASVQTFGVISGSGSRNDVDMFSFTLAAGGSIDLALSGWSRAYVTGSAAPVYSKAALSMLDAKLTLYDAAFKTVAIADDPARIDAGFKLSGLAGGTYYLAVDGTGWGDPTAASPTGWTEYGSLGQYMITGSYTVTAAPPPPPPPPPPAPLLVLDRTSLATTEAGGADTATLRALNATGDILVSVSGLDATEGSLAAPTLLLNAANNWTATLGVTGRDDRDADGAVTYALTLAANGIAPVSLQVTNADDDITPVDAGSAFTGGTTTSGGGGKKPARVVQAAADPALAADDGIALTLTETGKNPNFSLEWRWQFTGLAGGDQMLHVLVMKAESAGVVQASPSVWHTDAAK